jgi:RNA polymerase sigma-70 factor (ECF subfamily)
MRAQPPDADPLLAQARAGSTAALGELLESCRAYLRLVAEKELDPELRAKGSASDLVQQTFLEAHRDFGQFGGTSRDELLAWLRRLLLNNLANFSRSFRDTGKRAIDRELRLGSQNPATLLADDSVTPGSKVVAREQEESLRQALARLPDDYRQVIRLRHEDERTFEEIAVLMQRTANAVRKLWLRAVERLQQEMEAPP